VAQTCFVTNLKTSSTTWKSILVS